MIYGYIRVSSDKQTVENQRFEVMNFCERNNLRIDGWIEETISGTKNYNKRQLGKLLKRVQKDDLIICAELSRLGRSLFMIMEILNICMTKTFRARCWPLLSGCLPRLNAILSANEPRKHWLARKQKVLSLVVPRDAKLHTKHESFTARRLWSKNCWRTKRQNAKSLRSAGLTAIPLIDI